MIDAHDAVVAGVGDVDRTGYEIAGAEGRAVEEAGTQPGDAAGAERRGCHEAGVVGPAHAVPRLVGGEHGHFPPPREHSLMFCHRIRARGRHSPAQLRVRRRTCSARNSGPSLETSSSPGSPTPTPTLPVSVSADVGDEHRMSTAEVELLPYVGVRGGSGTHFWRQRRAAAHTRNRSRKILELWRMSVGKAG